MPTVTANGITMNYDQQGMGPPLILIPYLAADNACYAFQVGEYAKHFTCISLDLRGTGRMRTSSIIDLTNLNLRPGPGNAVAAADDGAAVCATHASDPTPGDLLPLLLDRFFTISRSPRRHSQRPDANARFSSAT
jgi:hypothetical protein